MRVLITLVLRPATVHLGGIGYQDLRAQVRAEGNLVRDAARLVVDVPSGEERQEGLFELLDQLAVTPPGQVTC